MDVLLIGCGSVGAVVASHLGRRSDVDRLVVADVDVARARTVARRVGDDRAAPMQLDAAAGEAVAVALQGADLLINAALPRFNEPLMEAALAAGVHYLDLAFWRGAAFDRDAAWRDRGLVALVGCGEDPGISNVLARAATEDMEPVALLRVIDGEVARSPDHPLVCLFSPETFLTEALGPARYYEDGALHELPPFSGRERYAFPPPVGPVTVYAMDHEELRTLPRFLGRTVHRAEFKLALDPKTRTLLGAIDALGLMDPEPVRVGSVRVAPRDLLLRLLPAPDDLRGRVRGHAALAVEATGTTPRGRTWRRHWTALDHATAYRLHDATATGYLTGTGAAAAAALLLEGRVPRPGVLAPEQLDPEAFLEVLRGLGVDVHREERVLEDAVPA